jgi:hypothetical protein
VRAVLANVSFPFHFASSRTEIKPPFGLNARTEPIARAGGNGGGIMSRNHCFTATIRPENNGPGGRWSALSIYFSNTYANFLEK